MLTVYNHLDAHADDCDEVLEREIASEQYNRKQQERRTLLDEHAEYLRALLEIDSLLDKLGWAHVAELPFIYSAMRAAMPVSIVAIRKER